MDWLRFPAALHQRLTILDALMAYLGQWLAAGRA